MKESKFQFSYSDQNSNGNVIVSHYCRKKKRKERSTKAFENIIIIIIISFENSFHSRSPAGMSGKKKRERRREYNEFHMREIKVFQGRSCVENREIKRERERGQRLGPCKLHGTIGTERVIDKRHEDSNDIFFFPAPLFPPHICPTFSLSILLLIPVQDRFETTDQEFKGWAEFRQANPPLPALLLQPSFLLTVRARMVRPLADSNGDDICSRSI